MCTESSVLVYFFFTRNGQGNGIDCQLMEHKDVHERPGVNQRRTREKKKNQRECHSKGLIIAPERCWKCVGHSG